MHRISMYEKVLKSLLLELESPITIQPKMEGMPWDNELWILKYLAEKHLKYKKDLKAFLKMKID